MNLENARTDYSVFTTFMAGFGRFRSLASSFKASSSSVSFDKSSRALLSRTLRLSRKIDRVLSKTLEISCLTASSSFSAGAERVRLT